MPKDTRPKDTRPGFEDTLTQLETLVSRMEEGNMSLEDSLAAFETGIRLTRECQSALQAAELKVQILTNADTDSPLTDAIPFTDTQDQSDNN